MRDHHTILTDNILVYDFCFSTSMTLDDERTMDSCFGLEERLNCNGYR